MTRHRPQTWLAALGLLLLSGIVSGQDEGQTLVLVGATVYPSPEDDPIAGGVVVIRAGKIVRVGTSEDVDSPAGATLLDCAGLHVFAGFQNSHAHFTESKWRGADELSAEALAAQLEQMLLRYGFTTVVDLGSDLSNTLALRERIESGEKVPENGRLNFTSFAMPMRKTARHLPASTPPPARFGRKSPKPQ